MKEELLQYMVALFQNVSGAMKAESALKKACVPFKIIPVPKSISSECGICVRFSAADIDIIEPVLKENGLVYEFKNL